MRSRTRTGALAFLLLVAWGCAGSHDDHMGPMGPSEVAPWAGTAHFMSISPAGDAVGISTGTAIHLRFGTGMAAGMEQYVDLHHGGLDGPTLPIDCGWSDDRTLLTCTPHEPLEPHTTYWVHVGGGMTTFAGQPVDLGDYGPGYGGHWVSGGMMSGTHAGHPWGAMASGWSNGGGFGMAFAFTTG